MPAPGPSGASLPAPGQQPRRPGSRAGDGLRPPPPTAPSEEDFIDIHRSTLNSSSTGTPTRHRRQAAPGHCWPGPRSQGSFAARRHSRRGRQHAVQLPVQQGWFDERDRVLRHHRHLQRGGSNTGPTTCLGWPTPCRAPEPQPGQPSSVGQGVCGEQLRAGQRLRVGAAADRRHEPRPRLQPLVAHGTMSWAAGHTPRRLTSEEQILVAADSGAVRLEVTNIMLNCHGSPGISAVGWKGLRCRRLLVVRPRRPCLRR